MLIRCGYEKAGYVTDINIFPSKILIRSSVYPVCAISREGVPLPSSALAVRAKLRRSLLLSTSSSINKITC